MKNARFFLKSCLEKRPILTNSIIYGTLCTFSEFSQQTMSKKFATPVEPYDKNTITKYAVYGTGIGGPLIAFCYLPARNSHINSYWNRSKNYNCLKGKHHAVMRYRYLDKKIPGRTLKISLKKLVTDQFTFTPALLVVFYTSMSIMEGKEDIFEECRQKFLPTFKTSCCFWIPAQMVNFMVIPSIFRVTYIGFCSFAWINILCYLKRQQVE